ncbi:deoxyribonuclease-2-beta-like [Panonychus citri]|uniref:deoxyribonuclease-2-beta-like n=1 Tax=Panonychus citri TaxID=50023 RepID=UPI00230758A8|nr:deoxyribonuclease-2-beta-like [Panonychus citri]
MNSDLGDALVNFLLVFCMFSLSHGDPIRCRNDQGDSVDWSVVYKIPKEAKNYQSNGLEAVYLSDKGESSWKLSKYLMNDEKNLIGLTLSPLYSSGGDSSLNYILYSDQPHKGDTLGAGGHSKGVIVFDSTSGYWLIHSVPSFPPDPATSSRYDYPATGTINGQIFLCLSFNTHDMLSDIIEQLLYIQPHVFSNSLSQSAFQQFPQLSSLIGKKWIKQPHNQLTLKTIGGQSLISFGKSPDAHIDIYSQLAAQSLKTDLLAETWRRGAGGPLPSECQLTYQVVNIDEITINYSDKSAVWSYMEDHSKWAISGQSTNPYICIGDINRMASQAKRGGGLVCMKNQRVWKALRGSINQFEPCPRNNSQRNQSFFQRALHFFTNIFTSKFSLPAKTITRDRRKKELR